MQKDLRMSRNCSKVEMLLLKTILRALLCNLLILLLYVDYETKQSDNI